MDTATSTGSRTRSATRSVERQESWHARTISLATCGSTPATGTPRSTACDQYSANHRPAWNEYTNRRGGWSWSTDECHGRFDDQTAALTCADGCFPCSGWPAGGTPSDPRKRVTCRLRRAFVGWNVG